MSADVPQAAVVPAPASPAPTAPARVSKVRIGDFTISVDLRSGGTLPRDLPAVLTKGARCVFVEKDDSAPALTMEPGVQTADVQEFFVSGPTGVAGVLLLKKKEDGGWTASMGKSLLPLVFS